MKKEVIGRLYILPYSGWSEVHSDDGISVFWFASELLLAAAPYVNVVVKVTYDDSIVALRRINTKGKDDEVPQMVKVTPVGEVLALSPAMHEMLKTTALYHVPMCWVQSCERRAAKRSAYCEDHTKQVLKERAPADE